MASVSLPSVMLPPAARTHLPASEALWGHLPVDDLRGN